MASPFTKPTLSGYNASPASDTGAAGGSSNIVSWAKIKDNLSDPLRTFANAVNNAVESAFQDLFGTTAVHMLFVQSSAPTGWSQVTSLDDRVLRLVDGAGAGTGGSWTISGLTMQHTHSFSDTDTLGTRSDLLGGGALSAVNDTSVDISGTTGLASKSIPDSDGTWRPSYVDVIRCSRTFA